MFLGYSDDPIPSERVLALPILPGPYLLLHGLTYNDQIRRGTTC